MSNTPPNQTNQAATTGEAASPIAASASSDGSTCDSEGEPASPQPDSADIESLDNDHPTNEPPPTPEGFDVQLVMHVEDIDPPLADWLNAQLLRIAEAADITQGEVTLAIVDDDEMAPLHKEYKKVEGTTDVLTFDLREYDDDPIEGDIVICLDEATRQAAKRGHIVREELLLYAVHGLLHLQGYDDHDDDDFKHMHQRENELLKATGFAALFDQLD